MITIMPADKAFLAEIAAPSGTDAMVLRDSGGTVDGYALFCVDGEQIEVLYVETALPLMAEGLVRAVLNTGDCRGAKIGVCRDASLGAMLKKLEFSEENGVFTVSIENFFHGECHCGK